MPCKIGVTKNPEQRRLSVETIYRTAKDWHILGTYDSKAEAMKEQRRFISQSGCQAVDSGEEHEGDHKVKWHVYRFSHGKQPKLKEYGGLKSLKAETEIKK